ncbi:Rne/Rng family ribonuclease [Deferribacter thermophilus]|uniref:Rne/Rng family ribonuclease n=1 Tax=Deferribacter thermophilus TaxID=53573 RepID=UPI003C17EBB1
MTKELIINSTVNETRVAILENGSVSEIYIERHNKKGVAGNIYKGKVVKVLPGMQSAFIDIGLDKAAFLHVADLIAENINEDLLVQNFDDEHSDKDDNEELNGKQHSPIEDIIQEGQEIVVQVAKEPIGQKGARLTTHLTIPGRYLVLMPYHNHIGVSRKIEDEEERERLKEILAEIKPENIGLIARTVSEGSSKKDLESDLDYLLRIWNKLSEKMDKSHAPELIYKDLELLYRTLRDLVTNDISRIVIDNKSDFLKLKTFKREYFPNLDIEIKLYENSIPIFDYYNIEIEINRMFDRVVWLKSGGYIVIDQAEALTVIDVNTGKFVGKRNFEETVLKTNLEAAKEIAYQLRLRNIGGIIIVDFIDMEKDEHIEKVLQTLNQEFKKDRGKVTVVNISPLGLFEITRKRVKESITKALSENCPYCEGRGFIKSKVTICYDILREIRRIAPYYEKKKVFVEAHSDVVDYMLNNEKESLDEIELMYNITIEVKANSNFHTEYYEVIPLEKF